MKKTCCILCVALICLTLSVVGCAPAECRHEWQIVPETENVFQCSLCKEVKVEEKPAPLPCETHTWVRQNDQLTSTVGVLRHYACAVCGQSKTEKVKNVVLIIGDGMGMEHISAGQLATEKKFCFTDWQFASVNTDCIDNTTGFATKTTDSAAAATALATGQLTNKRYVGKDIDGNDLVTIMDIAQQHGMKTGVVTTDKLYGATPSCFCAHSLDRGNTDEILNSAFGSNLNLLCTTSSNTVSEYQSQMTENGYAYCDSYDNRNELSGEKAVCLFDLEGFGNTVKLSEATDFALDYLDNENGFMLMVEQAHVDKNSHNNDFEKTVEALSSLNDTVQAVLNWIGDRNDTAILITADHETGDLSVSENKLLKNEYITPSGKTVYYQWSSGSHTDNDVGLFCYGFDLDFGKLPYFGNNNQVKNTDVFVLMKDIISDIAK